MLDSSRGFSFLPLFCGVCDAAVLFSSSLRWGCSTILVLYVSCIYVFAIIVEVCTYQDRAAVYSMHFGTVPSVS